MPGWTGTDKNALGFSERRKARRKSDIHFKGPETKRFLKLTTEDGREISIDLE
jgi:hypothetical protein